MAKPAQRDISIQRGSIVPQTWRFRNLDRSLFNMAGSSFTLAITWRGGSIQKALAVDEDAAEATWIPTAAEIAAIPLGRIARYRLSRSVIGGEMRVLVSGIVEVSDG